MARFFIDRPVFAWVIAIIIMLAGLITVGKLPVEQYPQIAPPSVSISANYPGASSEILEESVTQVIEQSLTGLDRLRYMSSSSNSSGRVRISLTFEPDVDPDIAQVQVQNKIQSALALLPQEVQQRGVQVSKSTSDFLMVVGFASEDGRLSEGDISDFVASNLQDRISRVEGVGEVMVFGPQKSMRIWLDPDAMSGLGVSVSDVLNSIRSENAQISAGQLGAAPAVPGQEINATVTAQTRMQTVDEFQSILLRVKQNGSQVRLGDVANVELGFENYAFKARYNGKPASGMGVRLASGANALDTAENVKQAIGEMESYFPEGLSVFYPYDSSPFIQLSIESVVKTLLEAVVLVFFVMLLFLGSLRATIVPTVAIPVVILGTIAILGVFGFSINTLTMFGMVLAIGLLVDDAIVVVENVERVMEEDQLSPKEATKKSMGQITGALIGIGVVLSAVFIPMAFLGGAAGVIYQQFSITIVSAMALSVVVAIVLSPAMCATILKPRKMHAHQKGFFGWFNRNFTKGTHVYQKGLQGSLKKVYRYILVYVVLVGGLFYIFSQLPGSFLPQEDRGQLFVMWNTPAGSTMERTLETTNKVEDYFLNDESEAVEGLFTITGFSFAGQGQNSGMSFVRLKDWSERTEDHLKPDAISGRAMATLGQIKDAMIFTLQPPSVPGLGNANGFNMQLVDVGGVGRDALVQARNMLLGMAAENPSVTGVRPNGLEDTPEYKINIDREKASALGISLSEISETLSTAWGGRYVNDFIDRGKIKRVYVQSDAPYRMLPEDLNRWHVRNQSGDMIPFSAFSSGEWVFGSPQRERYNGLPSLNVQGAAAPGVSSGAAMDAMEELASQLPQGIAFEWTGISYEEKATGAQAPLLYALSILVIFLCLAALYESWSIPFSVILIAPIGVLGAVLAAMAFDIESNIFFQIALLTTIGLASKNAILIVEFARLLREQGNTIMVSVVEAGRQRIRPIIMTSMAFSLGVTPLAISSGAGAESHNTIGIAVLGGVLTGTLLTIFFVPAFFMLIDKVTNLRTNRDVDNNN